MYGKILLILFVVLVVWWGFRALSRWQAAQNRDQSDSSPLQVTRDDALDLVHCDRCDAFRPRAAGSCGRPDCPRP